MTLFRISNDAYVRATISEKVQISFVLGDDLLSTKNVNPCMLVPPAKSCKTSKNPISINHIVSRVINWNISKIWQKPVLKEKSIHFHTWTEIQQWYAALHQRVGHQLGTNGVQIAISAMLNKYTPLNSFNIPLIPCSNFPLHTKKLSTGTFK